MNVPLRPFPNKKYEAIYADPPWRFTNKKTGGSLKSGAAAHYETMTVNEVCELPVPDIAAENCVLFMWWVASQPEEALRVVKVWGFELKLMTGFSWMKITKNAKPHFGMGFWTRAGSESCLIAVKGKPKRANGSVRSVVVQPGEDENRIELEDLLSLVPAGEIFGSQVRKHSKKPDEVRDRIVTLCGDVPRIELFARERYVGWDSWGLELPAIKPPPWDGNPKG
jgi:N6-adenosine-specific RNA methylase IME4